MKHKRSHILAIAGLLLAMQGTAFSQMGNAPFSFHGNATGMSLGGKQVILNDKLFGVRPENLVRDQNGILLDVTKGPGNSAIVSRFGTSETIPGYHGRSFTGGNPMMAVSVFNSFFIPSGRYSDSACCFTQEISGATINTWTSRVVSDGIGVSYNNDSLVDIWTGQVFTLSYY